MPNDNGGGWNFHVWEKHPETGKLFKYVGFFQSAEVALDWCRKQPRGKAGYRITNFSPTSLVKQHQTSTSDRAQRSAEAERKRLASQKRNAEFFAQQDAKRKAALAAHEEQVQQRAKQRQVRAKEREEISEGAAEIIEQHKADEQADLDAGINR